MPCVQTWLLDAQGVAANFAAGKPRTNTEPGCSPAGNEPCARGGLRLPQITATIGLPSTNPFAIPIMMLCFEDFPPGHFGTFGPRHVTREEILAFAAEFDPQPMHLDEEAAKHSMLKGLSGSGWHLCSLMMRMMCDGFIG